MSSVVVAPMIIALATAILTILVRYYPRIQAGVSIIGALTYAGGVAWLGRNVLFTSSPPAILTYQVSDWQAPFGITLVADALSVTFLALAAILFVVSLAVTIRSRDYPGSDASRSYHTLIHFMLLGVTGAFLTGDLFNLFVWFEVMLMSSYVLVVFYGGPTETASGLRYVVVNLVGSALMLLAIGGIYASTGTLNFADLARRLGAPSSYGISPAPLVGLFGLLLIVFALKAGLVPFQFWVPAAYRAAPIPVTALLSGIVKKVGVYGIIRVLFTVLAGTSLDSMGLGYLGPVLVILAVASIFVGGIGALGADRIDDLLSYSSIGQLGFVVLPLGLAAVSPSLREIGITAAVVYALSHGIAKAAMFLAAGAIRNQVGTLSYDRLGGLYGYAPLFSLSVLLCGLTLIGVPPTMGFFGKLMVFQTAINALDYIALLAALGGAMLTILYISRLWNQCFWASAPTDTPPITLSIRTIVPVVVLATVLLVLGIWFDPILDITTSAARAATDQQAYLEAVDLAEVAA